MCPGSDWRYEKAQKRQQYCQIMKITKNHRISSQLLPAAGKQHKKPIVAAPVATLAAGLMMLAGAVANTASADDIDIFSSNTAAGQKPNLLLLFDMSGSMDWDLEGINAAVSGNPSRADLLKEALSNVMSDTVGQVNLGVALWNGRSSGIKWPITDLALEANTLDADIPAGVTAREVIEGLVRTSPINGGTAPVNAMFEAAMYFRGGPVRAPDVDNTPAITNQPYEWNTPLNSYSGDQFYAANPITYTPANAYQPTAGGSWAGANYKSPVKSCQSNYMLLLTDGQPTVFNIQDDVENLIGKPCADLSTTIFGQAAGNATSGNCGPELVEFLQNNNQQPGVKGSHVGLYTIGLGLKGPGATQTEAYMDLLAEKGDGEFYTVDNVDDLQSAFNDIIKSIVGESENFSELSIDIDSGSLSNDDRSYFSLFKPAAESAWYGNTKGYFVDASGIVDINGLPATLETPAGTIFNGEAQSFWSESPDGNKINKGGASSKLDPALRNLVTNTSPGPADEEELLAVANELATDNNAGRLKPAWFGVNSRAERDDLITWLYNAPMGDPLHSKPVSVKYANKDVVFSMTNQGLLHAFDASTPLLRNGDSSGGEELFAFMPRELLSNIRRLRANTLGADHVYGLDGGMTLWHDEDPGNADGVVNNGEKAVLFIGMRRGGGHYYALDISNYQRPTLLWQINAGDNGFERLAQTWSRMSLVSLYDANYPQNRRRALLFAGGYDQAVLDDSERRKTAMGNAVYAVDAASGELIWSVSNTASTVIADAMRFSIASDLTVIDSNQNGMADRIYVGDLGGQLWRIDIDDDNSLTTGAPVAARLLASLGNDSNINFQPFFAAPSVSLETINSENVAFIGIGSGNRDQPLQNISRNRMFVIKDTDFATGQSANQPTFTIGDLYDASSNALADPAKRDSEQALLESSDGWFITLAPSEKAMTQPLVYQSRLLFTTVASRIEIDPATDCEVVKTEGNFYAVNLLDATPLINDGGGDDLDMQGSRSRVVSTIGIPSAPLLVFPEGTDDTSVFVGKTKIGNLTPTLARVYWYKQN